jgi:uncharacterized protein YndB with AHSA1/START domain
MHDLQLKHVPIGKVGMLIRKPVADVFEAFINPDITTKFWFTKSSGRLEVGKQIQWDWEMYDFSTRVTAKSIEPNRRIVIDWPRYGGLTTEWIFAPRGDDATFVSITHTGFTGVRRLRSTCPTGTEQDLLGGGRRSGSPFIFAPPSDSGS